MDNQLEIERLLRIIADQQELINRQSDENKQLIEQLRILKAE